MRVGNAIDALYNGFPSSGTRSTSGATSCGADKLRPIVTRGVLLDVTAGRRRGAGEVITVDELRTAAERAGCMPEAGDAVLIRTGWYPPPPGADSTYFDGEPGIDVEAAQWLADAEVAVVGANNYAVEVLPSVAGTFPVHQLLIRAYGVPLLEGLILDDLAAASATTFLFMAAPLPLSGGTAGPVTPVAVL